MTNDNMLIKYHSYTTGQDFYISYGYYGQEYNMENDHRKIKQVRIYSCLGVDPDCPKTDNIFPDTQLVFTIDGDLIKKFSFIHNAYNVKIYARFSSNINIEYVHPDAVNNFRDGIDEPWTKIFCNCFAVIFFEDDIEENDIKNDKVVEIYDNEVEKKTQQITELFMNIANKRHKTLEEVVEVYYHNIQDNILYN